jgi:hypothetical protein
MIRSTLVALALTVASSAQSMPNVPLQQPNNFVIPVRQGCGLGRQLVEGVCVRNSSLRAAVRKCSSRGMRMVNDAVNLARELPPLLARRDPRPSNLQLRRPHRVNADDVAFAAWP